MATKAVHLELISIFPFCCLHKDITAFYSNCTRLYSNNGTNFRGTEWELREMFQTMSDLNYEGCRSELDKRRID